MAAMVVGMSVSGIAAALELSKRERDLYIMESFPTDRTLCDSFVVRETPLNPAAMRGTDFLDLALEELARAGVHVIGVTAHPIVFPTTVDEDRGTGQLVFSDDFGDSVGASRALYAPNGVQPPLPSPLDVWDAKLGHISYSGWSDAPGYKGQPVAVLGCGIHAMNQALILSEWAEEVTLVCSGSPTWHEPIVDEARFRVANIRELTSASVTSIETDQSGRIARVKLLGNEGPLEIEARALFAASEPAVIWEMWDGYDRAQDLVDRGKLHVAGLAAGIDYWNHAALYSDGVRAAQELVGGLAS